METNIKELIASLSIESIGPMASKRDDWLSLEYMTALQRDGKTFWQGPYFLGIGHVDLKKAARVSHLSCKLKLDDGERSVLQTWLKKPHASFVDKDLQLAVAVKLAKWQKVAPGLDDVLSSLLLDGTAHFDSYTFPDWADCYGYDADSISARATFEKCVDTGRVLAQAFNRDELDALRERYADY